jgi:hypothetical protein
MAVSGGHFEAGWEAEEIIVKDLGGMSVQAWRFPAWF